MRIYQSKFSSILISLAFMVLLSGCKSPAVYLNITSFIDSTYDYHHYFPQEYFGSFSDGNKSSVALHKIDHYNRGGYLNWYMTQKQSWRNATSEINGEFYNDSGDREENAYFKKQAALILGKGATGYCFINYSYNGYSSDQKGIKLPEFLVCMKLDGVSNILYNVSYFCSIPAKLLHGSIYCFNKDYLGWSDWFVMISELIIGFFASIIMVMVAPIVGLVCHPWETVANLTVGLLTTGDGAWTYFTHVNLLSSLWDLVVKAIIAPIWDIISLFF